MSKFTGSIFVFISAVCFSAKAIMVKLAYVYHVDPLSLLFLRMLFSLPFFVIIPFLFTKNQPVDRPKTADYIKLVVLGILGYYASSILDFMGLQYITAGLERLILFIYPTLVVVLLFLFFKKPIGKREMIALVLTYMGILLVFLNDSLVEQKDSLLGALFIFASAFTYATYLIGSDKLIPKFGSVRFTAIAMIVSTMSVLTHYAIASPTSILSFSKEVYYFGVALAVFSTVIPTFLLSAGIKVIGAGRASIIASVGPVATIVMGYVFLNEKVTVSEMIGTALVLGGVLLVSVKK